MRRKKKENAHRELGEGIAYVGTHGLIDRSPPIRDVSKWISKPNEALPLQFARAPAQGGESRWMRTRCHFQTSLP